MSIHTKTPEEIEKMRVAGRLAAEVLQIVAPHVKPGVTTEELDRICHDHIIRVQQAIPANVGYKGYPKTTCISANNVICHGIPSESKVLKDGDIINIDVTVIKDGWHGDTSRMYFVGTPSVMARRLVEVTREAMWRGIHAVKPGATLGDIGHAIQTYAEAERFSVVREYCGHGIGKVYHDEPQVLHYGKPGTGTVLEEGMVFTIEPGLYLDGVAGGEDSVAAMERATGLTIRQLENALRRWPVGARHWPGFVGHAVRSAFRPA